MGCPVTYVRQSEKYEVKFQWKAPFPPSVLSHIEFFLIRVDKFPRSRGDIAVIEPTSFRLYTFTTLLDPFEDIDQYYQMSVSTNTSLHIKYQEVCLYRLYIDGTNVPFSLNFAKLPNVVVSIFTRNGSFFLHA